MVVDRKLKRISTLPFRRKMSSLLQNLALCFTEIGPEICGLSSESLSRKPPSGRRGVKEFLFSVIKQLYIRQRRSLLSNTYGLTSGEALLVDPVT